MPVLLVYGIPDGVEQLRKSQLLDGLRHVTSAISALKLKETQVRVFFPRDACEEGLGEELVCMVEGFFEKPERTTEVKECLASEIADMLCYFCQHDLKKCRFVEVYVPDPKTDKGFVYHFQPVSPL